MLILVSVAMRNVWVEVSSFDELYEALQSEPTYIDGILISILKERIEAIQPTLF
jgi:hypothetical protein